MTFKGATIAFERKTNPLSIVAVVSFLVAMVVQVTSKTPKSILLESQWKTDLSGTWEMCTFPNAVAPRLQECMWLTQSLPGPIKTNLLKDNESWVIFRKQMETPEACNHGLCSLVIAEVGDAVLLSVNGQSIARHGGFPPNDRYARHLPVKFDLPPSVFESKNSHQIELVVRSLKKSQTGVLRGPFAIVSTDDGSMITRTILLQNVLLPLVSSLGIALLSLFSILLIIYYKMSDLRIRALTLYGLVSMIFLASYSSVPREHLPLALTGCFHFMLRFMMDGAYFLMIASIFHFNRTFVRVVVAVYVAIIGCFPVLYVLDVFGSSANAHLTGFNGAVLLSSYVDYLLVAGPYLLGGVCAIAFRSHLRLAESALLLMVAPLPLLGAFTFHGVLSFPHFVCFFPFFVVLTLSVEFWSTFFVSQTKLISDGKIGRLAAQVAHDIQSPVAALSSLSKTASDSLAPEQAMLLNEATSRIQNIAGELIQKYRLMKKESVVIFETNISKIARAVVNEKLNWLGPHSKVVVTLEIQDKVEDVLVPLSATDMARVLSNVMNNAIDAVHGLNEAWVEVSVQLSRGSVKVVIEDNGKGISKDVLPRVRAGEGSFNKSGGSGIGISHAIEVLSSVGGRLEIESTVGRGTKVLMVVPSAVRTTRGAHDGDRLSLERKKAMEQK